VSFSALVKRSGEGLSPSTENVSKNGLKWQVLLNFRCYILYSNCSKK